MLPPCWAKHLRHLRRPSVAASTCKTLGQCGPGGTLGPAKSQCMTGFFRTLKAPIHQEKKSDALFA